MRLGKGLFTSSDNKARSLSSKKPSRLIFGGKSSSVMPRIISILQGVWTISFKGPTRTRSTPEGMKGKDSPSMPALRSFPKCACEIRISLKRFSDSVRKSTTAFQLDTSSLAFSSRSSKSSRSLCRVTGTSISSYKKLSKNRHFSRPLRSWRMAAVSSKSVRI